MGVSEDVLAFAHRQVHAAQQRLAVGLAVSAALTDGLAQAVLLLHQRQDVGGCMCGWEQWGSSHTEHVVQALRQAGVLSGH
jgi:hypothetical protein